MMGRDGLEEASSQALVANVLGEGVEELEALIKDPFCPRVSCGAQDLHTHDIGAQRGVPAIGAIARQPRKDW